MEEQLLRLAEGEIGIVGYGSLFSIESIGKTLKQPYTGPFLLARIEGWRRSWNVSMPNQAFYYEEQGERVYPQKIIYLNVRRRAEELMNCVVFAVSPEQLSAMHGREWIYDPVVVTESLRGVQVTGGDVIMYVAKPQHIVGDVKSPRKAAVRGSYLRIVERALQKIDPLLRAEYEHSTDPVPQHLVIEDKLDPERPSPWREAGHAHTIEE